MALQEGQRQHGFRKAETSATLCFSQIARAWTTFDMEDSGAASVSFVLLRQAGREPGALYITIVLSESPDVRV